MKGKATVGRVHSHLGDFTWGEITVNQSYISDLSMFIGLFSQEEDYIFQNFLTQIFSLADHSFVSNERMI